MAYNLGPVRAHVKAVADSVGPKFGITTIYGWRASDPFPDHPEGRALDFMTSSMATGSALAEYMVANAAALNVDYIIWNRRSWNSVRKTWQPYTGSNPHTDHVHVTFWLTPKADVTNLAAGGTPVVNPLGAASETLKKLEELFSLIADRNTWIRVSMFIGGLLFIAIGIYGASKVKAEAGNMAKTLGKAVKGG